MKKWIMFLLISLMSVSLLAQSKATQKVDALFAKKAYSEAAQQYKALAVNAEKSKKTPSYDLGYVYMRLGLCFNELRQYSAAEAALSKALSKGKSDAEIYLALGDAQLRINQAEKALVNYKTYAEKKSGDSSIQARIRVAEFAIEQNDNPEAKAVNYREEKALNTPINEQLALNWYDGALMFASNRTSPQGSKSNGKVSLFVARPLYDFKNDAVSKWLPIVAENSFASKDSDVEIMEDPVSQTMYVLRCVSEKKARYCHIVAYTKDAKGRWMKPIAQPIADKTSVISSADLSSDGKVMLFSMKSQGGQFDLYITRKTAPNQWSKPILVGKPILSSDDEAYPMIYRDSILIFSSKGHLGMGGYDMYYSKFQIDGKTVSVGGHTDVTKLTFSQPINLGAPFNSGADDYQLMISKNAESGYWISNRIHGNSANSRIFSFTGLPYVFAQNGDLLLPNMIVNMPVAPIASMTSKVAPIIGQDTVFIEKIVEKVVEKEVFVDGGEEQLTLEIRDREIAELRDKNKALSDRLISARGTLDSLFAIQARVSVISNTTSSPAPVAVSDVQKPVQEPVNLSQTVIYRIQIAAAPGEMDFRTTFEKLHQRVPSLEAEVLRSADGMYRYMSIPYMTFEQADAMRFKILNAGFECFVAGYRGEQRVSMSVKK